MTDRPISTGTRPPLRPEAREAMLAALETDRQSVVGAWRRPRGAAAGRAGARAGRGAGRRAAARSGVHLGRHRGQHAGALAGARRRCCWSRRSSILRCGPAAGLRAVEDIPVTADGVVDLAALQQRLAGRVAAAGLDHARQQRDRRDPAGRGGRRDRACGGRAAACRRGAGAGTDCLRFQGARRRPDDAVGAQDRRPAGRRRADQARCGSLFDR